MYWLSCGDLYYGFIIVTIIKVTFTNGYHIAVEPQRTIKWNGQLITERNLHNFLEKHEKQLLFGHQHTDDLDKSYKLVNVKVKRKSRSQRSIENIVNLKISNDDENNSYGILKLHKSDKLIDENFVFLKRDENATTIIDDSNRLARLYENCFYRNENSALDICDDKILSCTDVPGLVACHRFMYPFTVTELTSMSRNLLRIQNRLLCSQQIFRGILHHNSSNLIIHPLPDRFGINSHIIYEAPKRISRQTANERTDIENITEQYSNDGIFEPAISDFEPQADDLYSNRSHESTEFQLEWLARRKKRHIAANSIKKIPQILFIETAIFVDKDLFRHMAINYPKNTEGNLIRFVLAMINGVQLLYHHPSLGHQINFMLKRLEILHNDPKELRRSSDIDIFLNSFCMWQRKFNPVADDDVVHFDHAVILTGLDLYVVSKNGKISSQVVGLAPVAGMCTTTSSCTINEGKHFESVFVVAHEIGHNLGMRHDTSESDCDPSLFIMSPTLGSGKITWSKCSQNYLKSFLETSQARCLFDQGQLDPTLDHAAEGILPGERFGSDQQCMLKYGKDSIRSKVQPLKEICRDLHCQRDRYTWTSHPALEGTECGDSKWCRSGVCAIKSAIIETYTMLTRQSLIGKSPEKSNLIDDRKYGNLLKQEYNFNRASLWSEWSEPSECESGCLFGETGRLREGSTGLRTYRRSCLDYRWSRKKCIGPDKKYESCSSRQCYNVPRTTVLEYAKQICTRAKKFDKNILEDGIQEVSVNPEESCKVYCNSTSGKPITKSWTFPDGTTCRNQNSDLDDSSYCVNGRCEKFSCENSSSNYFKMDSAFCPQSLVLETSTGSPVSAAIIQENGRDYKSMHDKTKAAAASLVSYQQQQLSNKTVSDSSSKKNFEHPPIVSNFYRTKTESADKLRNTVSKLKANAASNTVKSPTWIVKSGCHFSCMDQSKGIQIVSSSIDRSTNIQLCDAEAVACDRLQTTYEFATKLCKKYQFKVRGLSGNGMQIAPSTVDPDRSCKVACQDEYLRHRFYLVNGEQGYFPFGSKCSRTNDNRYCVNGKCLEFGSNNMPLVESYISLALYRSKRDLNDFEVSTKQLLQRKKRNFLYYEPVNITEKISPELLQSIIDSLEFSTVASSDQSIDSDQIDLLNPIHIAIDDYKK